MPARIIPRALLAALIVGAALGGTTPGAAASPGVIASPSAGVQPTTSAAIAPYLFPNRLGARGALIFTIRYAGGESGVPSPVRRSLWRLPEGLNIEIPHLRICAPARLRARGPHGCPSQSLIGSGHALAEAHVGSQIVTEDIKLWAFVGPIQGVSPTLEILGQGYTPFDQRMVFSGTAVPDRAPYGEDLVITVPPIPTLPLEPDASIVELSLTIGTTARRHLNSLNTIVVPTSCPPGGFPFAAEFTYADGSHGSALAAALCP
jgi:hypothetical protein